MGIMNEDIWFSSNYNFCPFLKEMVLGKLEKTNRKAVLLLWNADKFDKLEYKIININIYNNENINY